MIDGFAYHKVLFNDHGKPVDYIYLEVNDAFEKMTGLKKENVVGRRLTEVIPGIEHDKAGWIEIYGRVILTREPVRFENYSETLKRWFAVIAYSPGSPYFATVFEDITERKNAEEALRESEKRLRESEEKARNLIAHAPTPIYEVDIAATRFLSVNDTVCELSGYSREELLARSPMDMVDQAGKVAFLDRVSRKLAGEEVNEGIEYKAVAKDGRELIMEVRNVSFSYQNGRPESVLVVAHDITERKGAEEVLRKAKDELEKRVQERTAQLDGAIQRLQAEILQRRRLEETLRESETQVRLFASQCLTAQETERRRVAAELHDSIVSALAGIKFQIEKTGEDMKKGLGSPESMEDLSSKLSQIIAEVRQIMADLRPSILDDLGILAAVNWLCREYQKTYPHITIEKQIGIEEDDVSHGIKTPIFRICQEAMNNVVKHSLASNVDVSLQKERQKIVLTIQDNGHGFDPEKVSKGIGLSSIRERATLSGGSPDLQSRLGKGTTVRVWWPI